MKAKKCIRFLTISYNPMIFTLIIFLLSFYAVSQATMTPPGNTIRFNNGVYVEVAYNSDMNPNIFTISCWAKVMEGENTWRTVVGSRDPNSISGYMIYAGAHNKWQFTIANGQWISLLSNDIIIINQWYHLAGVYDGNKASFYIDGQLVSQVTTTFATNSNRPFRIGSQSDTAGALLLFNGQIDEMRLWRVALTDAQIQNNKNKILYGTETGLVSYYNFDQTSGTTLKDHSNNNHDGTLMSTPTWDTSGITLDQPTITTISASQIPGSTNATLTGSINPNNYTLTDIRFEYGATSGQYDHNTVAVPAVASGSSLTHVSGITTSIPNALTRSTWYYRLTGKVGNIKCYGQEQSIYIDPFPQLSIRGAAQINNRVTLYGTINPANHVFTNLKFEYGSDTNYGNVIPVQQSANSGTQNIQVSGVIPLLSSGSYHYRLTGTTTEPFTYTSQDETFRILSPPGNALNFTGGGYVALANADFSTINSRVTIEFWMSGDSSLSNDFTVFEATNSNNDQILSGRFSKATNSMYFDVGDGTNNVDTIETTVQAYDYKNQWNHWAFVKDLAGGGSMKIYLNGNLKNNTTGQTNLIDGPNISIFNLGAKYDVTNNYVGKIDEFRIWNTARTQAEIQDNMHKTLQGTESGLVTYYNFDHTLGTMLADLANTNHGELKNIPPNPWIASGAIIPKPKLVTGGSSIGTYGATAILRGNVNAMSHNLTNLGFEYGPTTDYGNFVSVTPQVTSSNIVIQAALASLSLHTTYHYRVVGKIAQTQFFGQDKTFFTKENNPVVTTGEVISINTTGVKVSGLVNPNGNVLTAVHFEYYTAHSATRMTQAVPLSVTSGTNDIPVIATISGLDPFTLYYYRLKAIATNGLETTGFEQSFNMSSNAGLWIGQIELTQVNEVGYKSTDTQTPTDVSSPFQMKIILHEDTSGKVNLLRKVTLMQKVNTLTNRVTRHLITDDKLLPDYEGVVRRDGKLVGIRMSSLYFDFDSALNELPLMGSIASGNAVSGFVNLAQDHPNNPFRHLYHPDHKQGIDIIREIKMTFDPLDTNNPQSGVYNLKGIYEETLKGVHKIPIKMRGTFVLNRVSVIAKLNANQ